MSDDDGIQVWAPIEVVEGLLKRAEQAEAAIQRVRELCDEADRTRPRIDGYLINKTLSVRDIRAALGGEQ